ncbi:MAG: metallophosphoesterase, partial [Actinomycetota bacterium]
MHFGTDSAGMLRSHLEHLPGRADVFLLTGELTRHGEPDEAAVLADELRDFPVPIVAVLGNHDYHGDQEQQVRKVLEDAGIQV